MAYLEISPDEIYGGLPAQLARPRAGASLKEWGEFRRLTCPSPVRKPKAKPKRKRIERVKYRKSDMVPAPYEACVSIELHRAGENSIGLSTIERIKREVAASFCVTEAQMMQRRRIGNIVVPRMVAMFLVKEMTPLSFPKIGQRFGGFDHTTVLSAYRRVRQMMGVDDDLAVRIHRIRARLMDPLT